MELWDYQQQFISGLRQAIGQGHRRCLGYLPTGSGKTVVAGKIAQSAVNRGHRVLFLAHRDSLIGQAHRTFSAGFGLETGILKSGYVPNLQAPVQVAQVQSLGSPRYPLPPWHLCLIDEAHSTTCFAVVKTLMDKHPQGIVVGLTATPYRLGRQSLADHYTTLVQGPHPVELIQRGRLVPPRYFGYERLDLSKVSISRRTGDYDERQLQQALNQRPLNLKLLEEYQRLAGRRKGIVFATGIADSKALSAVFNERGIVAAHVDGSMPTQKRAKLYQAHRKGEIQVIVNVATLTEGHDEPTIECVVLKRPTLSRALYIQMVGRGLRTSSPTGKTDCIVLDFGTGNVERFGRAEDPLILSLAQSPTPSSEVSLKPCRHCRALVTPWHYTCPECGHDLKERVEQPRLLEPLPQEVAAEHLSPLEVAQQGYYRRMLLLAYRRSYKPGYALVKFKQHYGHYPPAWWSQGAVFGPNPTPAQQAEYLERMCGLAEHHGHGDDWVERQLLLEFGQGFNLPALVDAG